MAQAPREQWSSRLGFVLAAIGSAVGLGNMWRFSYLTAESGGAAFLLLYVVLTAVIGLPVLLAELTIGRGARKGPIEALEHFGGRAWKPLGGLFVLSGFVILAYYSVIAGWTLRYAVSALTSGFPADPTAYFERITGNASAVGWHVAFMGITVATVLAGVKGGIERLSLLLMPLLFAIICGLAAYAATLEGGAEGYRFYLAVDMAEIFDPESLIDPEVLNHAASQAFFSLSLGMGAILTYSSYLPERSHLPNASLSIAFSDFAVAFVAGLAVFPMVFAFGLADAVNGSTIGALFITLPRAFLEMGGTGTVVGTLFFAALVIGALTSAISLLEVVVASAMDHLGWTRHRAAITSGGAIILLGIGPALHTPILGLMDQLAGNSLLIAGGLALSVFAGWRMQDPLAEVSRGAEGLRWFGLWKWLLRIPVPLLLAHVLWRSGREVIDSVRALLAS